MCGITGAHGGGWEGAEQALGLLRHRGPDGEVVTPFANGYLGHTRLAIVDVAGGQQPMPDDTGKRWLICNGEIYNHPLLREKYSAYAFKTHSDSEDILAAYHQCGADVMRQLEGMYAFAIRDGEDLLLARDPLGIKPLYFGRSNSTLYFASEIKALQDQVDAPEEFPAGHVYTSRQGMRRYYDLEAAARRQSEPDRRVTPADVRAQLEEAIISHLMSDVPLGVFLSGGLDSSIIAAVVAREQPNVHSFSVGMAESRDLVYAREVARHIGTTHHEEIYTEQMMIDALPDVIYYLESFDPALVRSAVANYFLARLARRYVKVILSGEGADELYSGYSYLKRFKTPAELEQELLEITAELHNRNLQRLDRMTMAHGLEGRVPFLDRRFVEFSFTVPIELKLYGADQTEKWILRKAFEDLLPYEVVWRPKEKFAEGAGSAHVFVRLADRTITDEVFAQEAALALEETGHTIRSKEELYYYRVFRRFFKASTVPLVGFSRSL
ncbi:MAG: asparagine synthase B [Anaerolinea sp.]|nr:asparagine synthase B [Anaerolinea sp.]